MSCFDRTEEEVYLYLKDILDMNEKYGAEYKISILHNKEVELIEFLLKCYDNAKQMPSRVIFENNFPDLQKRAFDGVPVIVLRITGFMFITL